MSVEIFIIHSIIGILAAIIGYCWVNILTEPDHVFGFVKKWFDPVQHIDYLYKPLIGCALCNSGQWAMWFNVAYLISCGVSSGWDIVLVIYSTALAIVMAKALTKIFGD